MTVTIYFSTFTIFSLLQRDRPPKIHSFIKTQIEVQLLFLKMLFLGKELWQRKGEDTLGGVSRKWRFHKLPFTTMEVTCPASILGEPNPSVKCQCPSMWHCKGWDKGCFIITVQGQGHGSTEDPPSFEKFKPQLDKALSTWCSSAVLQFEQYQARPISLQNSWVPLWLLQKNLISDCYRENHRWQRVSRKGKVQRLRKRHRKAVGTSGGHRSFST